MTNSKLILPVFLLWTFMAPAQGGASANRPAASPANLPKLAAPRFIASYPHPPALPVNLAGEVDPRAQIAACAHIAAVRGVNARTSGADYATQNRVLEFTFLLCMSGAPVRD